MSEKISHKTTPVPAKQVHADLGKLARSVETMMAAIGEMESTLFDSNQKLPQASRHLDQIFTHAGATVHQMLVAIEDIVEHQEYIAETLAAVSVLIREAQAHGADGIIDRMSSIAERADNAKNSALKLMDSLQIHEIASRKGRRITKMLKDIECRMEYLQDVLAKAPTGSAPKRRDAPCAKPDEFDLFDGNDQDEVDLIVSQVIDQTT
jgi:methyl-accepting chemotaxis protein